MPVENKVTIRPATRSDVPELVKLWAELVDHHRRFDRDFTRRPEGGRIFAGWARKMIASRDHLVLVAEAGDRLVGYSRVLIENKPATLRPRKFGSIANMCVTKAARGKGVGRDLLRASQEWLNGRGISRLEVQYMPANEYARFWLRMGFRPRYHLGVKWLRGRKKK